jgi:hypothetical protein
MKPRECPFCGEKPEKYRSTWYVCKKCEIDVPVEVWDYRHDDWRSDGWPEGEVLVLWDGRVFTGRLCDGYVDLDKEGIMPRLEKCKWKPLPESEGGGA